LRVGRLAFDHFKVSRMSAWSRVGRFRWIGSAEAFALVASLGDIEWGRRPMTYQFMAELT